MRYDNPFSRVPIGRKRLERRENRYEQIPENKGTSLSYLYRPETGTSAVDSYLLKESGERILLESGWSIII